MRPLRSIFPRSFTATLTAAVAAVAVVISTTGTLNAAEEKIILVGDSTVASKSGWGDAFAKLIRPEATVLNLALGGRSSKSFRDEGHWQKVLDAKPAPTWVLIQFGHNDQPGKGPKRETDAKTTFRENLARYVAEVRAMGAQPVLITSLTRRNFNAQGRLEPGQPTLVRNEDGTEAQHPDLLADYAEGTRAVAAELKVPLLDLHARSVEQMNQLGPEAAMAFDAKSKNPAVPDRTHLSEFGALETAKLVAAEVRKNVPALAALLQPDDGAAATTTGTTTATSQKFAFTPEAAAAHPGFTLVTPDTTFDATRGYGFLPGPSSTPPQQQTTTARLFAITAPEGNYRVTARLGEAQSASSTTLKAESRRLMVLQSEVPAGGSQTHTFTVNVRQPAIRTGEVTRLNDRELGPPVSTDWDDRLTFEFNGSHPAIATLEIAPVQDAVTLFIAGDSTVTNQRHEPYAGWGQMLTRFLDAGIAVSNQAESGLALHSFAGQKRLEKVLSMMKPGDYLFIQFGHNDQKNKAPGAGPFTTYKANLERFVAATREKGGLPVLLTPMERRRWVEDKLEPTLTDYAEAVRQVAREQKVPLIDLHTMSQKLYTALGPDRSMKAFAFYPANSYPGQDRELKDNTHHNNFGGYELARCVVEGIRTALPDLAKHLTRDATPFDPAQPDSPDTLVIPTSPQSGPTEKPAGS